jgi:hypothetical protein
LFAGNFHLSPVQVFVSEGSGSALITAATLNQPAFLTPLLLRGRIAARLQRRARLSSAT